MKLLQKTAFGETRAILIDDNDTPSRLFVSRDAALNFGETVNGKIVEKNATLGGYFVMTEKELSVFVPSKEKKADGESVIVQITKEARLGKDATGQFVSLKQPYNFVKQLIDETGVSKIEDWPFDTTGLIEEALAPHLSFALGATLHIERTNTCWTIDVDTARSSLPLHQINSAAAVHIAEQILLKNLSGIILIDFAGFKSQAVQKAIHKTFQDRFEGQTDITLYGFSKTQLYEIKRRRTRAALADVFLTPDGHWNTATTVYRIREQLATRKNPKELHVHPSVLPTLQGKIAPCIQIKPNFNFEQDHFEIIGE